MRFSGAGGLFCLFCLFWSKRHLTVGPRQAESPKSGLSYPVVSTSVGRPVFWLDGSRESGIVLGTPMLAWLSGSVLRDFHPACVTLGPGGLGCSGAVGVDSTGPAVPLGNCSI